MYRGAVNITKNFFPRSDRPLFSGYLFCVDRDLVSIGGHVVEEDGSVTGSACEAAYLERSAAYLAPNAHMVYRSGSP